LPFEASTRSAILAIEDHLGLRLLAIGSDGRASASVVSDARLTALLYDVPLDQLRLQPGRILLATPSARSRALPQYGAIRSRIVTEPEWEPIQDLSSSLRALRLPELDPVDCAGQQGCYEAGALDIDGRAYCVAPCLAAKAPAAPDPPAAPDSPAQPAFSPCPPGWTATDPSIGACEPPALPAPLSCAMDAMQLPRSSVCTPIGSPCPASGWSPSLPAGHAAIFVRPGATNGVGSMTAPFGSLAAGLARAAQIGDAVVALAAGDYSASTITSSVTVFGACVSGTRIRQVFVSASGATLTNLTITSSSMPNVAVSSGRDVRIESVLIDGGGQVGISVAAGATARAHQVAVRGASIAGLYAGSGELSFSSGVVEDSGGQNVRLQNAGAHLTLSDVAVRNTTACTARCAYGIATYQGAVLDAENVSVESSTGYGVLIDGTGSKASVRDLIVSETGPAGPTQPAAYGVASTGGAAIELVRALVRRTTTSGLLVTGGSSASLTDTVVTDMASPGFWGIYVSRGSTLTAQRLRVDSAGAVGIRLESSTASIADAVVRDTLPDASSGGEAGGLLAISSTLSCTRAKISGVAGVGLRLSNAVARLLDIAVADTTWFNSDFPGTSLSIETSTATARRIGLCRAVSAGLDMSGGAVASLADLRIDTVAAPLKSPSSPALGDGVVISGRTRASITRAMVIKAAYSGVRVIDTSSTSFFDLHIQDTTRADTSVPGDGFDVRGQSKSWIARSRVEATAGAGVAVFESAGLSADGVHVRGSLGEGITAHDHATLDLSKSVVESGAHCGAMLLDGTVSALADLEVRDTQATQGGSGTNLCIKGGGGAGPKVELRAFSLIGADVGASLQAVSSALLHDGVIGQDGIGVLLLTAYDPVTLLDHVVFESSAQPIGTP
jgi:hypothetical protein